MASLSAVLLAGGKSQRMGHDKAILPLPGSGELLWRHQWSVLEELNPEKIFWSGPVRPGVPSEVESVPDAVRNAGPLAGVCACLRRVTTDLLVVLAVDLPRMDAAYLKKLVRRSTSMRGAVPRRGNDLEPLAAVYPKILVDLAEDRLHQGRYAMQEFVREAIRRELIEPVPVAGREAAKFTNLNSPADLDGLR